MASMPVLQISYPRQREDLHDETRMSSWLEAIAAQGYYLTQRTEGFYSQWLQGVSTGTLALSAGLSAQAQETLRAFCAGERDQLACEAFALSGEIKMEVDLWYSRGAVLLSVDDRYFSRKTNLHRYQRFLDLVELTYRQWHPIYGFDYSPAPGLPDTTREQALALEIPCLYRINLFGPELVEKLGGREHVLNTPAWQVKALDDGGILVATIPYVEPELVKVTPYSYQAAARHLGLPEPQIRFPDRSQFSRG